MNKILVTLCIPIIDIEFDSYLPINKKIGTIKKYLLPTIKELAENMNFEIGNIAFINCNNGKEYMNNLTVKEAGIVNGEKIIIIIM